MDIDKTITILEALAAGYSPLTGVQIDKESLLNERDIIRAFQFAIDHLKNQSSLSESKVNIPEGDIQNVINLFREEGKNPNANSLYGFFMGNVKFKNEKFISNPLFGKLRNTYTKGQVLDYFTNYCLDHNFGSPRKLIVELYRDIDFFQQEKFNRLTDRAVDQLKEKVKELGILKIENIPDYVQAARKVYPRAYESWSEKETELLSKAIKYTNDLDLLSQCFQRGKNSIEILGKKLIHESQKNVNKNEID